VTNVELRRDDHLASVTVVGDQLSLAIGKGGQNVRLAAKLTNWKITIMEEGGRTMADSDVGEIVVPTATESALDENGEKAERADEADVKATKAEADGEPLDGNEGKSE
ncbi:MAG TPA: transcription termination/antitermination protein NusA, partial [Candidatus Methylomirabilis sp.]|nr:transcription termination/antitermination protein NusA [Candidatus Methylomirabilis sp.]